MHADTSLAFPQMWGTALPGGCVSPQGGVQAPAFSWASYAPRQHATEAADGSPSVGPAQQGRGETSRGAAGVAAQPEAAVSAVRNPAEPCKVRAVEWDQDALEAERQLCARAQTGDRDAMGEMLRQYGPRLFRCVLLPKLGNYAQAEEALSTTYIKVVERFDRFTWQDVGVYPWLRVVAMRVALDMLRKRKRERLFDPQDLEREIDAADHETNRTPDALELHDLAIAQDRVKRAMSRINPRYAQVIQLRILEEKTREEAAETLGVSLGTLDVVLHRAMAALKKATLADGSET